jgi:hypothetical protein
MKVLKALVAVGLCLGHLPAYAQNITGLVVSSCGVVPSQFRAGNPGPFTVDTSGQLCNGTGGSVSASSVNGVATGTGLVVSACGNQTFKAGNPGPFTVDSHGNICN